MGHWYSKTGEPCYEVPNKSKGGMRDTTQADARKLGLVPSVTTILQVLDKPALNVWMLEQLLKAVVARPFVRDWDNEEEYKAMIRNISKQESSRAANLGNDIHDALESHYKVKSYPEEFDLYVKEVSEYLTQIFGVDVEWIAEASFGHKLGFGGKCDLHSVLKFHDVDNPCMEKKLIHDGIIVDFKTKSAEDFTKVKAYDEHCMQLAAYREGLGIPNAKCYNLFISTHESSLGQLKLHEWTEKEMQRGWKMFNLVLQLWKEVNNFGV